MAAPRTESQLMPASEWLCIPVIIECILMPYTADDDAKIIRSAEFPGSCTTQYRLQILTPYTPVSRADAAGCRLESSATHAGFSAEFNRGRAGPETCARAGG